MANEKTSEAETERPPAGPAVGMEEVYYAALPSLDELTDHEERTQVAINWVKYVLLDHAEKARPPKMSLDKAFELLCLDFALEVTQLPAALRNPCPGCSECKPKGFN